jgi:hypothetical protein
MSHINERGREPKELGFDPGSFNIAAFNSDGVAPWESIPFEDPKYLSIDGLSENALITNRERFIFGSTEIKCLSPITPFIP